MAHNLTTDDVIDAIYAQAAGEGYWSEVLTLIETLTRSHGAFFTGHDVTGKRPLFRLSSQALQLTDGSYNDRVYLMNDRLQKLLQAPAGSFIMGNELTSDTEFEKSPFYNEFMREHGLYYTAGGVLENDGETAITFGSIRTRDEGDFEQQHIQELKNLLHHVHRAFKLRQVIERRDNSFRAVQNAAPFAVFVLDGDGLLLDRNDEAGRLLEEDDGFTLHNGCLATNARDAMKALRDNLGFAVALRDPDARAVPHVFTAPRPSGMAPYTVTCLPVTESGSSLMASLRGLRQPVLMVCVADAERAWNASTELLRQQYDLTQREAEIVEALTAGLSVEDICEKLNISVNTARTHLKKVFLKTGTERQADIIRKTISSNLVQD